MKPAVVVIGAGINGLVAAHYLRKAGCQVTLLERADRAGGACISEVATVNGHTQQYALGASVLGLIPDFIFRETGLRFPVRRAWPCWMSSRMRSCRIMRWNSASF